MSETKDKLIDLITKENVSAIQTMVDELELTSEDIIELINELLERGELTGSLTEDKKRFFKSEVKLSDAPRIEREDTPPSFLAFNTRPPLVISLVGILVIAGGLIINALSSDLTLRNIAAMSILLGLVIALVGLCQLSRRKTPS